MRAGDHDSELHKQFCIAFGKAGLIPGFLDFAARYDFEWEHQVSGPNLPDIVKIVQAHNATAKSYAKFRVVEIAAETFNGWWWTGALVLKRYNVMEIQFEGNNGVKGLGSTLTAICNTASRLIPSLPEIDPPYRNPRYDGDNERLDRILGELIAYLNGIRAMIRRDLADFPKGSL